MTATYLPTALGFAALLIGLAPYRTLEPSQAAASPAEQQLAQLRQQVATLEHRVTELEKNKGAGVIVQPSAPAPAPAKAPVGASRASRTKNSRRPPCEPHLWCRTARGKRSSKWM